MDISNKPCQCPNTDYWVDDPPAPGTNSPPAEQRYHLSDNNTNIDMKFCACSQLLE